MGIDRELPVGGAPEGIAGSQGLLLLLIGGHRLRCRASRKHEAGRK